METFNSLCILAAGILAALSVKRYQYIAIFVFIEFALHAVVYDFGMKDTKILNKWAIYGGYLVIQLPILYYLFFRKSHFAITALISINALMNVCGLYFGYMYWENGLHWSIFNIIYSVYPWFVGMIMLLELTYLGWLTGYVKLHVRQHGYTDYGYIDRLFCVNHEFFSR